MKILGKELFDMFNRNTQTNSKFSMLAIREVFNKLKAKNPLYLPMIMSIMGLILIAIVILLIHRQSNQVTTYAYSESRHSAVLLNELKDVNAQLQTLTSSPQNSASFQDAIVKILNDVVALQNTVVKSSDIQKVSTQISSVKDDMDSQMLDLKRQVAGGLDSKQYLDAKILPFHVLSIDVISQQPFVSIDYANHVTPFAVGDSIAGWTVVSADYDSATAEFKNEKDQYVKVSLQG